MNVEIYTRMKQKLSEYIAENYAGRGPSRQTLIARIKNENDPLQGVFEGGLWFVYLAPSSTGNERADSILRKLGVQ